MISFYDKNRKIVLKLSDFNSDYQIETRIKFTANISYAFFTASSDIEDFKVYLENFSNELKLLYDSKVETAQFVPFERQIEIYFKQFDFDKILVTIKLNHSVIDYSECVSTLTIQYEIDQSFIPDLINEINVVLAL